MLPSRQGTSNRRGFGTTRTLKLTLAYDGAGFVGWQRQAEGVSIQGLVEDALSTIEGARVTVAGAGRTDAGAHALGQVASFRLSRSIEVETLRRALNAMLPGEVRVVHAEEASPDFHARYAARSKTYRYYIVNGESPSPFERRYVRHVPQPLRLDAMREAARLFEGRHDFAAIQAAGSSASTTVRTVFSSAFWDEAHRDVCRSPSAGGRPSTSRLLVYEITGDGFLRHMVRTIAGTLVEVGSGRRDARSVSEMLVSGDRRRAGPTSPACGLWLVRVAYGE